MKTQAGAVVVPFVSRVAATHARLMAWDMTLIKAHAVQNALYRADEVDIIEAEYKKWLALVVVSGERLPISKEIDPLWHEHIIFTQDYTAMGLGIAGRYIHHRPAVLDDEKQLVREFSSRTLQLYRENFGEPDPKYWSNVVCGCDGRCGRD